MSALAAETYDLPTLLDAWESVLHAVSELAKRLDDDGWNAPTECPGWSVGDVVRHLSWIEAKLAGRPEAEHEIDWSAYPHVASDLSRMTETGVDVRRRLSQAEVCQELDGLIDVRLSQILMLDPLSLETEVMGVFGRPTALERLLRIRCFDSWTHLQDIRRAVGLPGDLAIPAAQASAQQMASSTAFVLARNVDAPVGTTMRVTVTGPIAFERWAGIDDDGQGTVIEEVGRPDEPTISIATDWETYARLGTGRLDASSPEVLARVTLDGDPVLAARIPAALAITP